MPFSLENDISLDNTTPLSLHFFVGVRLGLESRFTEGNVNRDECCIMVLSIRPKPQYPGSLGVKIRVGLRLGLGFVFWLIVFELAFWVWARVANVAA